MRRIALFLLAVSFIAVSANALTSDFGPIVIPELCSPKSGETVGSISQVTFTFDCSKVYEGVEGITPDNIHINSVMTTAKNVRLYKGTPTDGSVIATIIESKVGEEGNTSLTLDFDKEYALIEGETYSIAWDNYVFVAKNAPTGKADKNAYNAAGSYTFIGGKSEISSFDILDYSPTNSCSEMNSFSLLFSKEVTIADNSKAILYEGEEELGVSDLSVNADNECMVTATFENIPMYYSHKYVVKVDDGAILEKDTENAYGPISIDFEGTAYKYFGYGRISPANGREVSYFSTIKVPIVGAADNQTLYSSNRPHVLMYEGDSDEPMADIMCDIGSTGKELDIPVWNFSLNPSTTYRFEMAANQCSLWEPGDRTAYIKVEDTANSELSLSYTTPATLEPIETFTFASSKPESGSAASEIATVKVEVAPYEFEGTSYNPVMIAENPEATLRNGDEVVKTIPLTLSFEEDSDNNTTFYISAIVNETLYRGSEYTLEIPEGIIGPSITNDNMKGFQNASKNKAYSISLNGDYSTVCEFTYNAEGVSEMTTSIAKGSTLTITIKPTENFKIDTATFNGEEITIEDETYTTPVLNEDTATLVVNFAYDGEVIYDFTSGVDSNLNGCPLTVTHDTDHIIISGIEVGTTINIYSVGGLSINSTVATQDIARIRLNSGVYVIVVGDIAIKYRLP